MTHYLDHAASAPVDPAVIAVMAEQLAMTGNASSLHTSGRAARRVVEESRETIAAALGARPSEVIFTSGGTEADNLAVKGVFAARRAADPRRTRLVVSAIEHHAVLDAVEHLVDEHGARVTWALPDADGIVPIEAIEAAILSEQDGAAGPADVALVVLMWANNEIGTVQPVAAAAALAHEHGLPLHTDAVQAIGCLPVDFADSGADLLALTGHKFGATVGVGALLVRREIAVTPLLHGGGQERQIRSGTLDTPAIRGLALAVDRAVADRAAEATRLAGLRDRLITGAMTLDPTIRPGGWWAPGDVTRRLPGNAHLLVPGCEGDSLLYLLDAAGIECSTGSACQAGVPQPSHVLLAMGLPADRARGALRLTLGRTSTDADVDAVLAALPDAVDRARRAASPIVTAAAAPLAGLGTP